MEVYKERNAQIHQKAQNPNGFQKKPSNMYSASLSSFPAKGKGEGKEMAMQSQIRPNSSVYSTGSFYTGNPQRKHTVVCKHWLKNNCYKGKNCDFLHQYIPEKIPECPSSMRNTACMDKECKLKHNGKVAKNFSVQTGDNRKDCIHYKLGFCINGPYCKYKHVRSQEAQLPEKLPDWYLQKICGLSGLLPLFSQQTEESVLKSQYSSESFGSQQPQNITTQQVEEQKEVDRSEKNSDTTTTDSDCKALFKGTTRFFIIKSLNYENIEISQKHEVWATSRANTTKLVSAFKACDNVILLFSVNESRHFQGYAKMTSLPTKTLLPHVFGSEASAYLGFNFSVRWTCKNVLSFNRTQNIVNPWNDNLPIKVSRDCQELPPDIGTHICSLLANSSVSTKGPEFKDTNEPNSATEVVSQASICEDRENSEQSSVKIAKKMETSDAPSIEVSSTQKLQPTIVIFEKENKSDIKRDHNPSDHQDLKDVNPPIVQSEKEAEIIDATKKVEELTFEKIVEEHEQMLKQTEDKRDIANSNGPCEIQKMDVDSKEAEENTHYYLDNTEQPIAQIEEDGGVKPEKDDDNLSATTSSTKVHKNRSHKSKKHKSDKKLKTKKEKKEKKDKKKKHKKDKKHKSKHSSKKEKSDSSKIEEALTAEESNTKVDAEEYEEKLIGFSNEFSEKKQRPDKENFSKYSRKRFKADSESNSAFDLLTNQKDEQDTRKGDYYRPYQRYYKRREESSRSNRRYTRESDDIEDKWSEYERLMKESRGGNKT